MSQGCILSSLLFVIFINALDGGVVNKVLKFADDTKTVRRAVHNEQIKVLLSHLHTGVYPAGDAGDTSPNILVGGRQREYPPILLRTFGYSRPILVASVHSASSRFYSAIRRQQFASVRQADSRLTRL